uniref:Uncharacterized protein n=1 Tax=Lotharella globosa TaxID=91324 RepID=A0A7S4DEQ1_9EUKA|mmetsp:Transcript_8226/g.16058  ORF Transcript_8226/g.16058 Transcript_8226/m.16058 type:complete len:107 (-) Transcript_8226:375-695(-)|eukprot:CAMPEP_0167792208 /NCGR_PEP_ID=MMETSP0111_2-20121227/12428_1 /TAXON_ID=91324 /ORGANISM="Lotharella globosa, Strain CCCM811" /LENGTH=106 /DNA_ID=CAMNT_0007685091 /DNA_START=76 /DNA_END=396 /DNA_ORIENTATION=+
MAFNDLCECLYSFIQRQMREVNGVIESNSGHTVYTDRGFNSASEAFNLPATNNFEVSNTTLVTTVFVVLMMSVLLLMGRQNQPEPVNDKHPRRDGSDEKKDRGFLQ